MQESYLGARVSVISSRSSTTPLVEISFAPQPSSALKIQDGGQTFHKEVPSVRSLKIRLHCRLQELCHDVCSFFAAMHKITLIALFNNMRALKFKGKLTITFYAAVIHYRNGHPKAETSKMNRNPPITNQERDLLTSLKYRMLSLVSREVRYMIDGSGKQILHDAP